MKNLTILTHKISKKLFLDSQLQVLISASRILLATLKSLFAALSVFVCVLSPSLYPSLLTWHVWSRGIIQDFHGQTGVVGSNLPDALSKNKNHVQSVPLYKMNLLQNGDTALHITAAMGRRKLTRILLEIGINRNVRNKQSETALGKCWCQKERQD